MTNEITFEEFEQPLEKIRDMVEFQDELSTLVSRHGGDCFMFPDMVDDVVNLLELIMDDDGEWISYFVYELNFGREYEPGTILDDDGTEIPLITIRDLWDLLKDNQKRKANANGV